MKTYANVGWTVGDVQSLRPSMTDEQAAEWLENNGKYVSERLVELGWEVLEALLDPCTPADDTADHDLQGTASE